MEIISNVRVTAGGRGTTWVTLLAESPPNQKSGMGILNPRAVPPRPNGDFYILHGSSSLKYAPQNFVGLCQNNSRDYPSGAKWVLLGIKWVPQIWNGIRPE